MADIKQIQVGGTNYNIAGAAIVLEDNGTTTDGVWLAKTNQISSLVDGQMFLYKTKKGINANGCATLNITANGIALGEKSISVNEGYAGSHDLALTRKIVSNEILLLIYNSDNFILLDSPATNIYNISKIYSRYNDGGNINLSSHGIDIHYDDGETKWKPNGINFDNNDYRYNFRLNGTKIFYLLDDTFHIENGEYGIHISGGMDIKSTKVFGSGRLILATGDNNNFTKHRVELDRYNNQTKIYLNYDNQHSEHAQMKLTTSGMYYNRPIHLASDGDPDDCPLTLSYNSTDDCLDIIFE